LRQENKNIIEKAMAILNRQPKKPETLIQIERERAAVLSRIRKVWRRLFGIDIDAKNHLRNNTRPTPLVDAILAEIKTEKKPDEVKTKKRTRLPIARVQRSRRRHW